MYDRGEGGLSTGKPVDQVWDFHYAALFLRGRSRSINTHDEIVPPIGLVLHAVGLIGKSSERAANSLRYGV
jgi:hypothetical protein